MKTVQSVIVLIFAVMCAASTVLAQVDVATATLKGTIADPSGAVVAAAMVSATSVERGTSRQAASDSEGRYQIPLLQPGEYDLRFEATGFQPQVAKRVVVTIGQIVVFDLQLRVGDVTSAVDVTTDVPSVETQRTQQANTLSQKEIENLPLVNRSFTDLAFTQPGVVSTAASQSQNTRMSPTRSSGMSVGGGNGRSNYFTIDGGENELGTGGLRVRNLSVDAVQEFQINRNSFAAEYGFTSGSAINVVTKGGSNTLHGGAYGFYRSQKTSAGNAFDPGDKKLFEQRIYPGFTLGGPIVKNKAFFFTSYEMLKLDESFSKSYTGDPSIFALSPNQEKYFSDLTSGPTATPATRQIADKLRTQLKISDQTLNFFGDAGGSHTFPTRTHNWTSRLDGQFGNKDNLTGRFTLGNENDSVFSGDNVEGFGRAVTEQQRDYTSVGTWTHVFGKSAINQARVQFVKDNDKVDLTSGVQTPALSITGILNYGTAPLSPSFLNQKRYQAEDIFSWSRARHDFKAGVSYRPVDMRISNQVLFGGIFQFASYPLALTSNVLLTPQEIGLLGGSNITPNANLTPAQAFQFGLPLAYQQGFGDPLFTGTQQNLGMFAQDSWHLSPRWTIDAGIRIDHDGEPKPLQVNNYVSPRFGFAWDMWGNGKTVLRGGGGTFYAPVALMIFGAATLQGEEGDHLVFATRQIRDAIRPAAIWDSGVKAGKLPNTPLTKADLEKLGIVVAPGQPNRRVSSAASDYENPSTVQVSLGISQQLSRDLSLELSYQAYHGVHLPLGVESNYREAVDPKARCATLTQANSAALACEGSLYGPVLEPINSDVAQSIKHTSWGNSIYHGMTASLDKRFSSNYGFQLNYTLGKSIDDVIDFQGSATPFLPTRRYLDRGLSTFDVRHNFSANGVFSSPFHNAILRNITLSPIVNIRSGVPFTFYIGKEANGDANLTTDRPFYAPRNSGIGPNYFATNLRLNKRFVIKRAAESEPTVRGEFIVEATNIFNKVNFMRVNDAVCPTTCEQKFLTGPFDLKGSKTIAATLPLGFTAAFPGRELQFGIKLGF